MLNGFCLVLAFAYEKMKEGEREKPKQMTTKTGP